jgi:HTH-like domain
VSERWACRLLGQCRGTQRYTPIRRIDEDALTAAIVALASHYGRYGYRRITALLNQAGFKVGKDRVQRIWRREGLKVPHKQRPRGRLWLNDGSCVRLRPEQINHVWSYDFMTAMTHDGRSLRLFTLLDEFSRGVSCHPRGTALREIRSDRDLGRGNEGAWRAAYSLGQRAGVRGEGAAAMARAGRLLNPLH